MWAPKYESNFQKLKEKLTVVPILAFPVPDKEYMIYTDTSKNELGYVLMQERKVTAYVPQQLKPPKLNYLIHDLELATAVHAMKIWRHHPYRVWWEICTNYKILKYFFQAKVP